MIKFTAILTLIWATLAMAQSSGDRLLDAHRQKATQVTLTVLLPEQTELNLSQSVPQANQNQNRSSYYGANSLYTRRNNRSRSNSRSPEDLTGMVQSYFQSLLNQRGYTVKVSGFTSAAKAIEKELTRGTRRKENPENQTKTPDFFLSSHIRIYDWMNSEQMRSGNHPVIITALGLIKDSGLRSQIAASVASLGSYRNSTAVPIEIEASIYASDEIQIASGKGHVLSISGQSQKSFFVFHSRNQKFDSLSDGVQQAVTMALDQIEQQLPK